jgi:hypothetical protein
MTSSLINFEKVTNDDDTVVYKVWVRGILMHTCKSKDEAMALVEFFKSQEAKIDFDKYQRLQDRELEEIAEKASKAKDQEDFENLLSFVNDMIEDNDYEQSSDSLGPR